VAVALLPLLTLAAPASILRGHLDRIAPAASRQLESLWGASTAPADDDIWGVGGASATAESSSTSDTLWSDLTTNMFDTASTSTATANTTTTTTTTTAAPTLMPTPFPTFTPTAAATPQPVCQAEQSDFDAAQTRMQTCIGSASADTLNGGVAGSSSGSSSQPGPCESAAEWAAGPYQCCARIQQSQREYFLFRPAVILYRAWALHDATIGGAWQDMPTEAEITSAAEADLKAAVLHLPNDSQSVVNGWCANQCAGSPVCRAAGITSYGAGELAHVVPSAADYRERRKLPFCFRRETSTALVVVGTEAGDDQNSTDVVVSARGASTSSDSFGFGSGFGFGGGAGTAGRQEVVRVQERKMASLVAGDRVLVMDEKTGGVRVDRVSVNLHAREPEGEEHDGVALHYQLLEAEAEGEGADRVLELTASHVVFANGVPVAAEAVRVGDTLTAHVHAASTSAATTSAFATASTATAVVTRVGTWRGGITNPLTHTGRILAGSTTSTSSSTGINAGGKTFVAATTVLDSPLQVQLAICWMPNLLKAGSVLFPEQFQASEAVEAAVLAVADATRRLKHALPWAEAATASAAMLLFLVLDVCVGGGFLVSQLLLGALGAAAGSPGAGFARTGTAAVGCGVATLVVLVGSDNIRRGTQHKRRHV